MILQSNPRPHLRLKVIEQVPLDHRLPEFIPSGNRSLPGRVTACDSVTKVLLRNMYFALILLARISQSQEAAPERAIYKYTDVTVMPRRSGQRWMTHSLRTNTSRLHPHLVPVPFHQSPKSFQTQHPHLHHHFPLTSNTSFHCVKSR
jgi:hypothetical protein